MRNVRLSALAFLAAAPAIAQAPQPKALVDFPAACEVMCDARSVNIIVLCSRTDGSRIGLIAGKCDAAYYIRSPFYPKASNFAPQVHHGY